MKKMNDFFDNAEFHEAPESGSRNNIFTKSLALEKYMSMFLAEIMDVEDYLSTKSFGSTSSALSFNQKLNLFADLGYMHKNDKKRLLHFAEIRNLFAHNFACISLKDVFTNQISNSLRTLYPQLPKANPTEKDFQETFDLLFEDIKKMFEDLRDKIYNKKANEYLVEYHYYILNSTVNILNKHPKDFNMDLFNKVAKQVAHLAGEKFALGNDTFRRDIIVDVGKHLRSPIGFDELGGANKSENT